MNRSWLFASLAAAMMAVAAQGQSMQCGLTSAPLTVSQEGLAEPVGEIQMQCAGGPPSTTLTGTLAVTLSRRLGNRASTDPMQGLVLERYASGAWVPVTGAKVFFFSASAVQVQNVQAALDSSGAVSLRLRGLRAESGGITQASVQFLGNYQALFPSSVVTVAAGAVTLLATNMAAVPGPCNQVLPDTYDVPLLISLGLPAMTSRVTEAWPGAFRKVGAGEDSGTRFIVRFTNVPQGARVLVPDAVAGSNATTPTRSGAMGGDPTGGAYTWSGDGPGTLVLGRVRDVGPDGAGGTSLFLPGGSQLLTGASDADVGPAGLYAVYEVIDSNPNANENAQIPAWIYMSPESPNLGIVSRSAVQLAPQSETPGIGAGPVPRYHVATPVSDCSVLGDCSASWMPKMTLYVQGGTTYSALGGGPSFEGSPVSLINTGGGVLEWRVGIRYLQGSAWLRLLSLDTGYNNTTIRYAMEPASLTAGRYEAQLVFSTPGAADQLVPVVLNITQNVPSPTPPPSSPQPLPAPPPPAPVPAPQPQPAPPPSPVPAIQEVVVAGSLLAQPVAPGSLAVVRGVNLSDTTKFAVGGLDAAVMLVNSGEVVIEIPLNLNPVGTAQIVASNNGVPGRPFDVAVAAVSPSILFMLNADGTKNDEARPSRAGTLLRIYVTGVRLAQGPLTVYFHDLEIQVPSAPPVQTGANVAAITVPSYMPAMRTNAHVCARDAAGNTVCSHPEPVWLQGQ